MSKLTDLADLYLAMREIGASGKEAYTVRDMIDKGAVHLVSDNFPDKTDQIEREAMYELEDRLAVMQRELNNEKRENIRLLGELRQLRIDVDNLHEEMERIKEHCDNPKTKLTKLNKKMKSILNRSQQLKTVEEIDLEIKKLNEMYLKTKSFRFEKKRAKALEVLKYNNAI
ncbi:hypothetical protein ES705_29057 [subsurface metagenome]